MLTNYERIKAMSVEEMAELFSDYTSCEMCPQLDWCIERGVSLDECKQVIKQWLESEAENDR